MAIINLKFNIVSYTELSQNSGRMLNVNNIGLLGYKTVKVATLNSITQIVFHTPTVCI
jgi:hypothetical protein